MVLVNFFGSRQSDWVRVITPKTGSRKILEQQRGTPSEANINPLDWFTDVLSRIQDHPVNQLHELLPQNWVKQEKTSA